MEKELKISLEKIQTIMEKDKLSNYSIEIMLQKDDMDVFAVYIVNYNPNEIDEKQIYIGGKQYIEPLKEYDPHIWLAALLKLGYTLRYCSLSFHSMLWELCGDTIRENEQDFYGYLLYCKQHHITSDLLEQYNGIEFHDLFEDGFVEVVNSYTIIERFTVLDRAFLFGVNDEKKTFAVCESNSDYQKYENEKFYTSYLTAFSDFQERIKKYTYDRLKIVNETCFSMCDGDKELDQIMNGKKNLS